MNKLAKWMMRLYPAAWRARYGDEMEALLADSGADAKTVADLLTGGMRMRFSKGSFLKLALSLGVAGLLLGVAASYLWPRLFESRATLQLTPEQVSPSTAPRTSEVVQQEQQQVRSRTRLSAIMNDPHLNLYSDERRHTPLEDVIDKMRGAIHIDYVYLPRRGATAFNIRFQYPDKLKAQQTVKALMGAFMAQNHEMQIGNQQGYELKVLDAASLPDAPVGPARYKFGFYGCLLGFLLACAISVFTSGGHSSSTPMLATNE